MLVAMQTTCDALPPPFSTQARCAYTPARYASDELKADREFMLTLLRMNGPNGPNDMSHKNYDVLRHASNELRADREFILDVLQENSDSVLLHLVGKELWSDPEFVFKALERNKRAYGYVAKEFWSDREVLKRSASSSAGRALLREALCPTNDRTDDPPSLPEAIGAVGKDGLHLGQMTGHTAVGVVLAAVGGVKGAVGCVSHVADHGSERRMVAETRSAIASMEAGNEERERRR